MLLTLAFWRSIWRTFFIQASWSFERMQNLGFLYAMLPGLRSVIPPEKLDEAVRRHSQFFNTHPYFASTVVGAVLKLEEEGAKEPSQANERNLNALKAGLMGSLGAIGDSLFWAALRPFAAWVGVFALFLDAPLLGSALFLLIYNLPHLLVRFGGAAIGYAAGLDVVRQLRRVDFPGVAQRVKGAAVAGAFAALPFAALPLASMHVAGGRGLRTGSLALATLLFVLIGRGFSGTRLAAGFLAIILAGSWLWETFGGLE
jgi:mannose/fructose/N-acetylgalactosamine-specific phosphotransferase system component IID